MLNVKAYNKTYNIIIHIILKNKKKIPPKNTKQKLHTRNMKYIEMQYMQMYNFT